MAMSGRKDRTTPGSGIIVAQIRDLNWNTWTEGTPNHTLVVLRDGRVDLLTQGNSHTELCCRRRVAI